MQAERRKATAALAAAGKDMRRAARADGKVWHSRRNSTPLLLALLLCSAPAVASREPNIVFILADDLGYNDVSLHGGCAWATPHIDSMARDGLELRSYYVQPVCSPSRASLLTGRHVIHTGVYIALNSGMPPFPYLSTELKLLPSYLPKHKSFLIGKWHLGFNTPQCLPLNRGFSSFSPGYINSAQDYFTHTINGNYDLWDDGRLALELNGTYGPPLYESRALSLLRAHDPRTDPPFFLFLSLQAVHSPYERSPNATDWARCVALTDEPNRQSVCAMVLQMDRTVGAVLDEVRSNARLADDTIVIFSSDNGGPNSGWENGSNNYPLRGGKGSLWEGGVRSTGLIQGPPRLVDAAGRGHVFAGKFHITDWLPTIVDLVAGADAAGAGAVPFDPAAAVPAWLEGDGVSQARALSSAQAAYPRDWVLLQTAALAGTSNCNGCLRHPDNRGVIVGDLKLLRVDPSRPYGVVLPGGRVVNFETDRPEVEVMADVNGWVPPPGEGPASSARNFSLACPSPESGNLSLIAAQCSQDWCLFNITADPCERVDLAASRPLDVQRLQRFLESFQAHTVNGPSLDNCRPFSTVANPAGGGDALVHIFAPCTAAEPPAAPAAAPKGTDDDGLWSRSRGSGLGAAAAPLLASALAFVCVGATLLRLRLRHHQRAAVPYSFLAAASSHHLAKSGVDGSSSSDSGSGAETATTANPVHDDSRI